MQVCPRVGEEELQSQWAFKPQPGPRAPEAGVGEWEKEKKKNPEESTEGVKLDK